MPLMLDDILEMDVLTDADIAAVKEAMAKDSSLAAALSNWFDLLEGVRSRYEESAPSRNALVLLALGDELDASLLSESEIAERDAARESLARAVQQHPALTLILNRIREDASDFERAWSISFPAQSERSTSRPARRMRLIRTALATAAVLAFIAVGVNLLQNGGSSATAEYATVDGQWKTISLEDGTEIQLGPDSFLETASSKGSSTRFVSFYGQAFFDVAPSPDPFVIETPEARTTVLGTSFGIQTLDGTEVTLITGRVSIAPLNNLDDAKTLAPGQQGHIRDRDSTPEVSQVNVPGALMWMELIVFNDTPMSSVVENLEKRFDVKIELSENLQESPLTGTFESESGIVDILEIITAALGAEFNQLEDGSFSISR